MQRCFEIAKDLQTVLNPFSLTSDEPFFVQECGNLLYLDVQDDHEEVKQSETAPMQSAKNRKKKKKQRKNKPLAKQGNKVSGLSLNEPKNPQPIEQVSSEEKSLLNDQGKSLPVQEEKLEIVSNSFDLGKDQSESRDVSISRTAKKVTSIAPNISQKPQLSPPSLRMPPQVKKDTFFPSEKKERRGRESDEPLSMNSNSRDAMYYLEKRGFVVSRSRGSGHIQYNHQTHKNIQCTVPFNSRNTLSPLVIMSIRKVCEKLQNEIDSARRDTLIK